VKHDTITIRVLECDPSAIPVRIKSRNGLEACIAHPLDGRFPFICIWKVEDDEVILRGCAACGVVMGASKLEVVRCPRAAKHYAVESLVVF
jgi:hypothetical protein